MSKTMLIDAAHAEETRVAIVQGRQVEEFDFESKARRQLRGNIYLAKVTRVEPSLQAAFVEYGGNRHGFLAFNEIHPDYYQIPVADREAIMAEAATDEDHEDDLGRESSDDEGESEGKLADEERLKRRLMRRYKIQDVIRRRQILLVQVVKDERGGKGAALTTWLSLAGRYCVLMPNTGKGGGISRKITQATDRKRLKAAAASLDVPRGMGLIIRTAGAKRTKAEIKRDYEYLLRLWETIRETTLRSNAPAMIHEEENLVRRAVRDMFDKDFDGIQVEGVEGWKEARDFMRVLMPSQAKKVHLYSGSKPLFAANGIEEVLHQIHQPVVNLKSGGYLVINQTEALVAIDVNSGRATKERNVEQTAFKTNMEAAAEAARQLRLRDLAGLIVIDFIDMEESKNNRAVEKCLKDALAQDRARIQMGKISGFGLMEISRQRRRLGVIEGATEACPHCQGAGRVRSAESAALMALRAVDIEVGKNGAGVVHLRVPTATALYILNFKRGHLDRLQEQRGVTLVVMVDDRLNQAESAVDRIETNEDFVPPASDFDPADLADDFVYDDVEDEEEPVEEFDDGAADDEDDDGDSEEGESRREARGPRRAEGEDDGDGGRRRRRGRRGGRRAREDAGEADGFVWVRGRTPSLQDPFVWFDPLQPQAAVDAQPHAESEPRLADDVRMEDARGEGERGGRRRRRRGRGRGERGESAAPTVEATGTEGDAPSDVDAANDAESPAPTPAEPKRRRVRRKVTAAGEGADEAEVTEAAPALDTPTLEVAAETSAEPEGEHVMADPEPAQAAEPEHVAAEPTPKAERVRAPLHSTEDDPAQITAPPPKPKRGWWRL
ncbi:Rne/Rng family ribonuclease [Brevundimonas sp.]|jgi:ribonuclease E|uniref:Rne/Rng family ribonuclease n=1 Tax=Brevundimonas sp. TaxID=1871086 RepID=UPI002E14EEE9|nr:Rne/Rng family ribonuclease [Brevundimonas sp.]